MKTEIEEVLCLQAERYRLMKEINQELVMLLPSGEDVNTSLDFLLDRIGKQYELKCVAILEYDKEKGEIGQINSWDRNHGIVVGFPGKNSEKKQDCFFKGSDKYYLFCEPLDTGTWTEFQRETFQELARMLSIFAALREHKQEDQRKIQHLKWKDPLTGLYVEEAFKGKVKEKLKDWQENMKYAIVYTDINDFSYINDNFGYSAGNDILKNFASFLHSEENMISCRLYSDLFIIFLWDINQDMILQRIVKTSLDFSRQQKEIYPSSSIRLTTGIYFMEHKGENLEMAIENANLTRKSIKGHSSAFCHVYESKMRSKRDEEKQVLAEFQGSLREGGFQVYVQPKFYLSKLELSGGEALVRWHKDNGKIESPDLFIPILEKSGYIVELDFYVYEQVLIYMRSWLEAGKEPPVISVNFSRSHFEGEGIYRRIVSMTKAYRIEPKYIEIEITESLFITGYELVKTELNQLRQEGFRVAIDDFGTGYSSLGMLLDIPADIVKVDKSFLHQKNCENGKEFIQHMGRLIESVKDEVIFEGIETEEQREFLVDCGFHLGQGFLFDRPMPIEVFQEKYMK